MAGAAWDPRGEAQRALRAIAADPRYGAEALSSPQLMTNLLKDMLPDAPREANALITAAGAGVTAALHGYLEQGMDPGMASQLAAGTLADRTALTADACAWATASLAAALRAAGSGSAATAAAEAGAATAPGVAAGGPTATITDTVAAGRGPGRLTALSLTVVSLAGAGALATILACAFSFVHIYNPDGTYAYSESLFSTTSHYGGAWHWMGPVVAAAFSIAAAVVLLVSRASWLRAAAAGVIAAFGAAVFIFFAAYQFTLGPVSSGAGPAGAEKLGAFGGFMLLVAGVFGIVAAAWERSGTPASETPAR
jgi:hypothetical protein